MKIKHSSLEIILGAGLLILALAFGWQLWRDKSDLFGNQYYIVKASLDSAAGIDAGSPVKMAGIKIGQVKSKTLNPQTYRAELELQIKQNIKLPKDSLLVVGASGLLGAPEIKIEQGNAPEPLAAGATFERTASQPSLEDMIGRAIFVLNAVGGQNNPSQNNNGPIKK